MSDLIEKLREPSNSGEACKVLVLEAADHIEQLEAQLSEHKAARIAYANEFPLNDDGEPDVGSIHENIRKMKAQLSEYKKDAGSLQWLLAQPYETIRRVMWNLLTEHEAEYRAKARRKQLEAAITHSNKDTNHER